jgi:hypothetical protein
MDVQALKNFQYFILTERVVAYNKDQVAMFEYCNPDN